MDGLSQEGATVLGTAVGFHFLRPDGCSKPESTHVIASDQDHRPFCPGSLLKLCSTAIPRSRTCPLEDALQLVHLYAERGSPKYDKAAMRWFERYLTEGSPKLKHFAELASDLAKREPRDH